MTTFLNPLHPATIFINNKRGKQLFAMGQVVIPAGGSLVLTTAPSADRYWIILLSSTSPPRDVITGNPIRSPFIYLDLEHSMITPTRIYALESYFNVAWNVDLHVADGDPLVHRFVNASAFTIVWDFTLGMLEVSLNHYDEYMSLWSGLENLLKTYFLDEAKINKRIKELEKGETGGS